MFRLRFPFLIALLLLLEGCAKNPCPFPNSFFTTWLGAQIATDMGRDRRSGAGAGCIAAKLINRTAK